MKDDIIINYTGWIKVSKEDLKLDSLEDDGMSPIDTSGMTADEIINLLDTGKAVIHSFGETYLNALDGEDDWTYEVSID